MDTFKYINDTYFFFYLKKKLEKYEIYIFFSFDKFKLWNSPVYLASPIIINFLFTDKKKFKYMNGTTLCVCQSKFVHTFTYFYLGSCLHNQLT